ncbi:MAG TPA: tRNA uridine-5-carboxymethylaminomethyl(34) synthesis GTPase MnmE [Candidatus Aminicenantes bacterium]|nr:tRNA uridine-5-carboxymethylaminomethyl(34) synthesis GTPase MnmE [Candidatus Aminicenantes bacterium]
MLEDTIIARATPPGIGGLGVVRISGRRALAVAEKIFEAGRKTRGGFPVRRPVFGTVRDPERPSALDEAFLTYFKAPRSYTREDVVEISAHGSPAVLEAIVRLGVEAGARPAGPGEFTLRAFLNGRLDIIQAEAVNDLVRSVSLGQARVSSRQLGGSLSRRVARLRGRLVSLLSGIEAGLEFPDEGLRTGPAAAIKALASLIPEVERLVASYERGQAIGEGVTLALVGRANVGKSTLFNALLGDERAIVTPYPGTTRDFLRETVVIGEAVFHLVDMAGLGRPSHPVEKRGVALGRRIAREADGLVVVLDASKAWSAEDGRLLRGFAGKKAVVVLNKSDLPRGLDERRVRASAGSSPVLEVSALKGRNIDPLRQALRTRFAPDAGQDEEVVLHARQRDRLQGTLEALKKAEALLAGRGPEELAAEELREAVRLVGELAGEVRTEEVLGEVFGRFCVGK